MPADDSGEKTKGRARIIQTVQTPLGFFVLVVLVVEVCCFALRGDVLLDSGECRFALIFEPSHARGSCGLALALSEWPTHLRTPGSDSWPLVDGSG